MPVDTLLDLPTKEKLATDTLDLVADDDFELDLRVIAASRTETPRAWTGPADSCYSCFPCTAETCYSCPEESCYSCFPCTSTCY